MKKTILLLLTLTLIIGVFSSCGYKTMDMFETQTGNSTSKDTSTEREETTEDTEDIDITEETTSEENESVSAITTAISEDTLNLTSETQGLVDIPEEKEYTYKVEKIDGSYYLVFNDYVKTQSNIQAYNPFYIPSLDFLKYTVPSGNMDTGYKKRVMNRISDNDSDHKVRICDIEHIWQPTFPDNLPAVVNKKIEWNFTSYTFTTLYENRPGHNATVLLEEDYKEALERDQEVLISYGYSKKELSDGEKELTVFYASGESVHDDGAYLYSYTIYVTNGQYHGIINIGLERELTDTELLQFGFEEYLG